ncbi:gamma-glutamylcyclotransferase [Cognatishimia sp. MH4019]|uniref:gamma-glutamylcyclotransferase n=1 Tax=Cognatishimia sp. MH4019 TaxID=2854030 RepID=UPI001CD72ADB|nr:gamma-glutamylcyclotransferase [Cognatishimia sp. MH4019]
MTLWVFGYGSLIWNPGFEVGEQALATLSGYHRSFCMWSVHHRGTHADPGLVLALDEAAEATCEGVAFRAADGHEDATLQALRERELISSAYLEKWVDVRLVDGRHINAVTYVIDPKHAQYTGALPLSKQAEVISRAVGGRGPNTEYLHNTADHLAELGIHDPDIDWLSKHLNGRAD